MKIDPKELEVAATTGIEIKYNTQGQPIGYKGPWLPDWYDNYTECLRENQFEKRRIDAKKMGLNEHLQTPEQEKAFKKRQEIQLKRKEKAETAAEMVAQNK